MIKVSKIKRKKMLIKIIGTALILFPFICIDMNDKEIKGIRLSINGWYHKSYDIINTVICVSLGSYLLIC